MPTNDPQDGLLRAELMTYADAAKRLGVSENRLRVRVRQRVWPCHRDGRFVGFSELDLTRILELMSQEPRPVTD